MWNRDAEALSRDRMEALRAANLRFDRVVGARLARQGILNERVFEADSAEGALICDEVVESQDMETAIDRAAGRLTSAGAW